MTLNSPIIQTEIKKCVSNLQNNKSPAVDKITYEFLKSTINIMLPLYTDYFNVILNTGIIPYAWLQGIIRPIYKRSGDASKPENYRPMTLVSCFSKLFTSIISRRLNRFIDE